jgi:hypothetical protein
MKPCKRFIFAALPVLLMTSAIAPAAYAQNQVDRLMTFSPSAQNKPTNYVLTPFNLVGLAYQGYFNDQGIPSYNALVSAYEVGAIGPRELAQSAIKANRLPEQILADQGYLNAVEAQLRALESD